MHRNLMESEKIFFEMEKKELEKCEKRAIKIDIKDGLDGWKMRRIFRFSCEKAINSFIKLGQPAKYIFFSSPS